jgi:hypothetical protein
MGKRNRGARRNSKKSQPQRLIEEPKTGGEWKETEKAESGLPPPNILLGSSPATSQPKTTDTSKKRKYGKYIVRAVIATWAGTKSLFRFVDEHHGSVAAVATIVIGVLTYYYVGYSKKQWETMRETLAVTQRSYVTIGRKDGVVAEFVLPKDPKDNAGIVMYFQNSGHIPAIFNWGPRASALIPPLPVGLGLATNPIILGGRNFAPMTRTRGPNKEQSTGNAGHIIGGDSFYVADVAELPAESINTLARSNQLLMINTTFEYCDELGTYSCRMVDLAYQGVPFNTWRVLGDSECPLFMHTVQNRRPNVEYLPPCETRAERQQEQKASAK